MSLEQYKFNNTALGAGIFGLVICLIELISGFVWSPGRLDLFSFIARSADTELFYNKLIAHAVISLLLLIIGFYIKWYNK